MAGEAAAPTTININGDRTAAGLPFVPRNANNKAKTGPVSGNGGRQRANCRRQTATPDKTAKGEAALRKGGFPDVVDTILNKSRLHQRD